MRMSFCLAALGLMAGATGPALAASRASSKPVHPAVLFAMAEPRPEPGMTRDAVRRDERRPAEIAAAARAFFQPLACTQVGHRMVC